MNDSCEVIATASTNVLVVFSGRRWSSQISPFSTTGEDSTHRNTKEEFCNQKASSIKRLHECDKEKAAVAGSGLLLGILFLVFKLEAAGTVGSVACPTRLLRIGDPDEQFRGRLREHKKSVLQPDFSHHHDNFSYSPKYLYYQCNDSLHSAAIPHFHQCRPLRVQKSRQYMTTGTM